MRLAVPILLVTGLIIAAAPAASAAARSNDEFANATTVGSLPFTSDPIDTMEATIAGDDPYASFQRYPEAKFAYSCASSAFARIVLVASDRAR